jgi:protein-S-isoprenylcysteine O-methyltransferase Ste14
MSHNNLRSAVFWRLLIVVLALGAMFFLPAGTLRYWEAWLYMAVLLIPMIFAMRYFLKYEPEFLERRMRMREKEAQQRKIINLSWIWFLLAFILPGLDDRFGWSNVPVAVVLLADLVVLIGYGIILRVFRENRYASRVVEVAQGQKVINTGPYAVVRHPMYVGTLLMYLASPVALGSWWALLPALLIVPILVARIVNEEAVLVRELPGYEEYKQQTRYRLIPAIW